MFSKSRPTENTPSPTPPQEPVVSGGNAAPVTELRTTPVPPPPAPAPKPKPAASVLSTDLTITGNVRSSGDIQIEGTIEGDVRAHTLIVGETATVKGEVVAEDVVVHGRVVGRLRGLKVRLSTSARVEGDIVHKTIAIESGAHFEGSVQRQEDPLSKGSTTVAPAPRAVPQSAAATAAE
jgi:cytoskeletal protein CcmA (bactofilin family)